MDELLVNPNTTQEHQYQLADDYYCLIDPNLNIGSNSSSSIIISSFSWKNNNLVMNPNQPVMSRYERQKRRDWNIFRQYLRNHYQAAAAPLSASSLSSSTLCSGAHVIEFLRYLDQFGKTKVHNTTCPYFGCSSPTNRNHHHTIPSSSSSSANCPCPCPNRQAWGSLDALVGRLRAAFDEEMKNNLVINPSYGGGRGRRNYNSKADQEKNIDGGMINIFINNNPFGARSVRLYLRQVKDYQSKARGVSYEKKKKKKKIKNNDDDTTTRGRLINISS